LLVIARKHFRDPSDYVIPKKQSEIAGEPGHPLGIMMPEFSD
jgi:hypothetical protein